MTHRISIIHRSSHGRLAGCVWLKLMVASIFVDMKLWIAYLENCRAARLEVAVFVALRRLGYAPTADESLIPPSVYQLAASEAASTVRQVGQIAKDHGAPNDEYNMYEAKGQVLVVVHGVYRFRRCNFCKLWGTNRKRWCSGCKNQTYCSRQCQKDDWREHKASCRGLLSIPAQLDVG